MDNMEYTTLVLGASLNPERYSNMAMKMLRNHQIPFHAVGWRPGHFHDVEIFTEPYPIDELDTLTLYLNPRNQIKFYDEIVKWAPRRVIFNPGTENPELYNILDQNGIKKMEACTLVMLSTGSFKDKARLVEPKE